MTSTVDSMVSLGRAAELAAQLRVASIRSSTSAGSGHPKIIVPKVDSALPSSPACPDPA